MNAQNKQSIMFYGNVLGGDNTDIGEDYAQAYKSGDHDQH